MRCMAEINQHLTSIPECFHNLNKRRSKALDCYGAFLLFILLGITILLVPLSEDPSKEKRGGEIYIQHRTPIYNVPSKENKNKTSFLLCRPTNFEMKCKCHFNP